MCAWVMTICFDQQMVLGDKRKNLVDVIAGVNDHRLTAGLIANDGTVALEWSDGKDFVNHEWSLVISRSSSPNGQRAGAND